MKKIRLQKFLADAGLMSRRAAEEEIARGRVSVNGHPAEIGTQIDPAADLVVYKGKKVLFEKFGIDRFAEVKVANLSTGMKQKVSLVISIVHDPDIIIFDEPTNGLDVLTAKVVTDFLQELKADGKTIIVSTHIFNLIEKLCDRVGIIIQGKMILCDSLDAVCAGKNLEDRFFDIYRETVGDAE